MKDFSKYHNLTDSELHELSIELDNIQMYKFKILEQIFSSFNTEKLNIYLNENNNIVFHQGTDFKFSYEPFSEESIKFIEKLKQSENWTLFNIAYLHSLNLYKVCEKYEFFIYFIKNHFNETKEYFIKYGPVFTNADVTKHIFENIIDLENPEHCSKVKRNFSQTCFKYLLENKPSLFDGDELYDMYCENAFSLDISILDKMRKINSDLKTISIQDIFRSEDAGYSLMKSYSKIKINNKKERFLSFLKYHPIEENDLPEILLTMRNCYPNSMDFSHYMFDYIKTEKTYLLDKLLPVFNQLKKPTEKQKNQGECDNFETLLNNFVLKDSLEKDLDNNKAHISRSKL